LWQRRFGGDPSLVGKKILLNAESRLVVGIMPAGFKFPIIPNVDVWRPIQPVLSPRCQRGCITVRVMARLKPGVTEQQGRAELTTIAARIEQQYPDTNMKVGVALVPLHEFLVGPVKTPMLVLLAAVGFVLLIACANVANLLLARSAGRVSEMAIRASLGAGRWRIARQLLSESLLLAAIGGVTGLLLSYWLIDALIRFSPQGTPRLEEIGMDYRALGYTLTVTILTGMLFGMAPIWQLFRMDLNQALRDGSKGARVAQSGRRALSALVVVEVALALTLLVGAGLLIRSFIRLQAVNPGFNPSNLLTSIVRLPSATYNDSQVRDFYNQLAQRVGALPGVQSAGAVSSLPLAGYDTDNSFVIEGRPAPPPDQQPVAWVSSVSPEYFHTMGMRLVAGRGFTELDNENSPKVVVISEATARRHFPNEDPIGKRVGNGRPDGWSEIVGVMADVKYFGLTKDAPVSMYFPFRQRPSRLMFVVARTAAAPLGLTPALRGLVAEMDRNLAVSGVSAMDEVMTQSIGQERFTLLLLGVFAAFALLLSMAGIYGVMSYAVAQRTREIGVRMALGAEAGGVLRLVIGQGMRLALIGVGIGLFASLALSRLMKTMLFGVNAGDPLTFISVGALLSLVALVACYVPARRASQVDPMIALRCE
jgi:putative ABC transport system permease protein